MGEDPKEIYVVLMSKLKLQYFYEVYLNLFIKCALIYVLYIIIPVRIMHKILEFYPKYESILSKIFFGVDIFLRAGVMYSFIQITKKRFRKTIWWLQDLLITTKKSLRSYKHILADYIVFINELIMKTKQKLESNMCELLALLFNFILLIFECILL
jgi:hypothetical protein